jgi:glycosyltransferase involved in cell wall biosynthesis
MTDQLPIVSILLIAMNHEKFIEQACKSIVNQSYKNIEVIFLDNNSKDKTFEIADRFFKDAKINYLGIKNNENKGVSENLNILVANSNGDYLSILSGDDWYEEANIESRLQFLLKNDLDVVLADGYKFIESKQEKKDVYSKKRKQKVIETIHDYYNVNLVNNITCNVGFFTKREILTKHKFDEQVHAEDWDINLRLSKAGYKFGFLDRKTFNYRILNTSLSHNVDLMRKSFLKVTEKYQTEIDSNSNHREAYNMRLIEFDIIDIKQKPNKTKLELERLNKLQFQLNGLKYKGIKRIFKNILLYFKNH